MATRLRFPSEEALRLALTGGLVPPEVQACPADLAREEDGSVVVQPESSLSRSQLAALRQAGVRVSRGGKGGLGRTVSCWPEIVPPRRLDESEVEAALVLFVLRDPGELLPLAGELLRLGCDRQELCRLEGPNGAGGVTLLRAVKPPYYTLARALERPDELRAFSPTPAGQERVWTELGYRHPLTTTIQAPADRLLLIGARGWSSLTPGPWVDLYRLIDIQLPGEATELSPVESSQLERLQVRLQLRRRAREAAPTLWVLHRGGVAAVDALIRQLPEREIARLLFAVGGDPATPVVLLRAREGRGQPPVLELPDGVALASWRDLSHLYLPADAILEPPLRRETIRRLLAPDPDRLTWLTPAAQGSFAVERIDEGSFAPLEEWVDYVVHSHAAELEPWVRAATFELDPFESVGVEWSERPEAPTELREPRPGRGRRQREPRPEPEEQPAGPEPEPGTPEPSAHPSAGEPLPDVVLEPSSADERTLAELEQRFLELEAPAEDPQRGELWLNMARLNTKLGRQRDAGLCWTRALWEADGEQRRRIAQHWTVAEAQLLGDRSGGDRGWMERLLADERPSPQRVRALCSLLVRAGLAGDKPEPEQLHRVQVWLDAFDEGLDVRSLWLAHLSLSRMAGGDALQLTRTRDRVLTRLFRGLSVELDVPTFLRFCGGGPGAGAHDTATVSRLGDQLEQLLTRFGKARRKRSAVEADPALTTAYVQLLFAHGFARLGQSERARELREQATAALPAGDAIHDFLGQAYAARVEQALQGLPAETPLPQEISGALNQLERFARYKVDRLRQASFILEPHERLDPVLAFQQARSDPRGEEFAPMRGMTDPRELSRAVAGVMRQALAPETPAEERDRLFDGVMDFFPMLPESEAVPHLRTLVDSVEPIAQARRCMLLEEALMLAGFFGRAGMVQQLVERLKRLIAELGSEHAAEVASTLGQCLRAMRRVGLTDEAGDLLGAVADAVTGSGTPVLVARLQLAAGLADTGRVEQAGALLREGSKAVGDGSMLPVERLELTRAMASAASHLPQAKAIAELQRLTAQLPQITDSFNTNTHFCLSVIQFMESLILGYASEQLALGQLGRRWLDEDEYLVRRRIHRDLQAVVG